MQVSLDIADSVIKHNQKKAKNSLENAKKDGGMFRPTPSYLVWYFLI
jgi:hypothetical protein